MMSASYRLQFAEDMEDNEFEVLDNPEAVEKILNWQQGGVS